MQSKISFLLLGLFLSFSTLMAQKNNDFQLNSPDGKLAITVKVGNGITWAVHYKEQEIILPSSIAMHLQGGSVWGENPKIRSSKTEEVNEKIKAINYKKEIVEDRYEQLTLNFRGGYGLHFRAYNDGAAYRFFSDRKGDVVIEHEQVNFNFSEDYMIYIPYANDPVQDVYQISFENSYQYIPLSEINKDTVAFAPVLVELPHGIKAAITEADLESYPGMFLKAGERAFSLEGDFARFPLEEQQGGHNNLQSYVMKRADYMAKTKGKRTYPWRTIIVSEEDKDLLNNDMVYKLASPSRIKDVSWIEPGKVAWDWWNDWNISGVDFRAGINTATYKYYADFAADHSIENILLDEGWAESEDIMKIVPDIDLEAIIQYAKQKGVGVWLWGGWLPLDKDMDKVLSTYAAMGIKGFKVDFMNRDDQKMVDFYYRLSEKAAEYKLMLDFHGSYKPTGLQRTYPNVVNFEGVLGLENAKWSNPDFPLYNATIPFVRMLAGPMDYTPGAMKNANKANFRAVHSAPMSQGTRSHQLALYILYEAPFNMLADNPTNYIKEKESTAFIASVPTVFDETVALAGKISEYAAIARRKGDTWYIGAITNWDEREITLDLSFLPQGEYEAEVFKDGINADREGTDYKREIMKVDANKKMKIKMAPGGGWAARIYSAQ